MSRSEVILKTAVLSRLAIFIIQLVSNILIPDHDADAYRYPKTENQGTFDHLVTYLFGGFVRWDANHFMHIAKYGYTYEHTLAFFPLLPYSVSSLSSILGIFVPFLSSDSIILVTFVIFNLFCFICAALSLYELSLHFMSEELAYKASILFCFNPASVFFSAPYTESLFCYLSFKSMVNCVELYKKYGHLQLRFVIPICLSTVTRSNGVLNIGFLVYTLICLYFDKTPKITVKFILSSVFAICVCIAPFVLFQIYSYYNFCKDFEANLAPTVLEHEDVDTFVLPGTLSKHNQSWCFKTLPLAYSYVQSHYWKVGFLQYYQLKQIPNFLLASPIVIILLGTALEYFKQFPKHISQLFSFNMMQRKLSTALVVFMIHATALTIFCLLNIHVQVTTRMLCSASPVLYWICARHVSCFTLDSVHRKLFCSRSYDREWFILSYFLGYFVVGTVLFCNFLPWT